jgi:cell division protein FtsN
MFLIHLNDNVPVDNASSEKQNKKIEKTIKPTFDFYTLLPETETVVTNQKQPQQEVVTSPPEEVTAPTETALTETQTQTEKVESVSYMLQVGSFRKVSDADGFKAKLAFLGIESKVQKVTIDNKDTWHRVQVGPISGREKADALQKRLKENGIDSLLMRAKHS